MPKQQYFDLGQVVVDTDEDQQQDLTIEEKSVISQKSLKSHKVVDVSEILADELIEATMIRKSGYGNEVGLRGFTKSNLRFLQDNTIIEGSCGKPERSAIISYQHAYRKKYGGQRRTL